MPRHPQQPWSEEDYDLLLAKRKAGLKLNEIKDKHFAGRTINSVASALQRAKGRDNKRSGIVDPGKPSSTSRGTLVFFERKFLSFVILIKIFSNKYLSSRPDAEGLSPSYNCTGR
jgi:hypothetical protein